jgi:cation transport protein ChaC
MTDPAIPAELMLRDPLPSLQLMQRQWAAAAEHWVFGYASLIWRPEFDAIEHRPARVQGWHRALRMPSRVNRGTPQQPGLVFALLPGGACCGVAYRLRPEQADTALQRLWAREMVTGVYDPRLLPCKTAHGVVPALAFTLSRRSPACLPRLDDADLLHVLRHARGRYGSTLEYVLETAQALRQRGIPDRALERTVRLALQNGLTHTG